ncbi:Mucin-16 [Varanus komodoensis]|nr:Mucin-16 [Varanus komodoensis]
MDAVCTYRNDSTTPVFDRVKVYHEIVNWTMGFSQMGPYALDRDSFFVNAASSTKLPAVDHFTVNFTVTNLKYNPEMARPHSRAFNATERALTTLLGRILTGSSIGPVYSGCRVTALRPVRNGDETGMDAVCAFQNDSTKAVFDRVKVYREIVNKTTGFSKMGPYDLERHSLFVHGYSEGPAETTAFPMATRAVEHFTVNFTVTNLNYKPEMGTPNSSAFNATERALTALLGRILTSSSIGSAFVGCKVTSLSSLNNGDETGMDAVCAFQSDPTTPIFDRVKVYHELVNKTKGFSKMGPYDLERHSLYINGYNEVPMETTTKAVTPVRKQFTINVTVTNLKYKPEMGTPNSQVFSATERALVALFNRTLSRSSIGPAYLGCKVAALRSVRSDDETAMDAVCTYRSDSAAPVFDRVKVYHEIVNQTKGVTKLGPYTLDESSLYVNEYNKPPLKARRHHREGPAPGSHSSNLLQRGILKELEQLCLI